SEEQLAGARLFSAHMPSGLKDFAGIKATADTLDTAQKGLISLVAACAYSALTISTTSDAGLLTNAASSPLPLLGTIIPLVGFYVVGPLVLLSLYIYLHLTLLRAWGEIGCLPSVLPDGRRVGRLWGGNLLSGFATRHVDEDERRMAGSRLEAQFTLVFAWGLVPATLVLFWARYLRRHDPT